MRPTAYSLLALLLTLGSALADPPPGAKATEGEATHADGSKVPIALNNDAVAIETKYGKLVIPAADIERIEFAFRISEDVAQKIAAAVKRLGDANFKEREGASKALLTIGARAYPALQLATEHSDKEIAERAKSLLTEIRARLPRGSLKFPKEDRIKTATCTVSGRVMADIKLVPTARPGEPALKLADLRLYLASRAIIPHAEPGIEVGKAALDIEGKDIDDKYIRLKDYRGKVVLLVFWGNWCPPCRAMYPQLKSLVEKNTDEPFALLGVNSDKDRDGVKKTLADQNLTWRSFWNGGSTSGPISKEWKVQGWPTLYLIDDRGVIRQKWVGSPGNDKLVQAVDALVKEVDEKD